jgi:hypothetical protein
MLQKKITSKTNKMKTIVTVALCYLLGVSLLNHAQIPSSASVNGLQQLMFYRSFVQDDPKCKQQVTTRNGRPVFAEPYSATAAATCPDAFAWVQLTDAISQSWWNWGIDQTIWTSSPWPLCSDTQSTNCCDPNAKIDPKSQPSPHCPVFRGDYASPSPLPSVPNGDPTKIIMNHGGKSPVDVLDPGRLLRDLEVELVFRNKSMVDYIYRNNLYSKEGLGVRNWAQNAALTAGQISAAHKLEVRFPVDAVMVKADFIHQDIMLARGLISKTDAQGKPLAVPNNLKYPYLTIKLTDTSQPGSKLGIYYMLAMTNASKSLPMWHWYAMEHVANLGRCDYIGCNDSFGYSVNGKAQAGADFGNTFIPPKIKLNDDITQNASPIFKTATVYDPAETGEKITAELQALFKAMGIATAKTDNNPDVISKDDPAWLNYRLKGTQSSFTTLGGVPTGTGATITEGGFVNSASCATCHSQASVNAQGQAGMQGVGATWRPNLFGFNEVEMGSPNPAWFYSNGGPNVNATQIDFVWGILGANCINPGADNNCASYPSANFKTPFAVDAWTIGSNAPTNLVDTSGAPNKVVLRNYPQWETSGSTFIYPAATSSGTVSFNYALAGVTNTCPASFVLTSQDSSGKPVTAVSKLDPNQQQASFTVSTGNGFGFALNGEAQPNNFGCKSQGQSVSFTVSNFIFTPR